MSKKQRVKFIRHPGKFMLAYHEGEEGLFDDKQAKELQKAGVAMLLDEKEGSDLPGDLPGRDAIAKAGISFDELRQIENFEEIKGVGKPTAEKLKAYFKK